MGGARGSAPCACPRRAGLSWAHRLGSTGEHNFQPLFKCFMDRCGQASLKTLLQPIERIQMSECFEMRAPFPPRRSQKGQWESIM